MKSSPCSPQLEKAHAQQWRPNTARNKLNKKIVWNKYNQGSEKSVHWKLKMLEKEIKDTNK